MDDTECPDNVEVIYARKFNVVATEEQVTRLRDATVMRAVRAYNAAIEARLLMAINGYAGGPPHMRVYPDRTEIWTGTERRAVVMMPTFTIETDKA